MLVHVLFMGKQRAPGDVGDADFVLACLGVVLAIPVFHEHHKVAAADIRHALVSVRSPDVLMRVVGFRDILRLFGIVLVVPLARMP
ncbi:MAG: hypothetical protein BWY06_03273 [Candidatus Latescibacteria bacterium ADurb.Bin168]|nr:MAG: hypothetical protein BWY06_03273 [Candidatus Latescibacteria bacterium ADurb.Bin168]